MPVSAGGYHQDMMIATAKGLNSFITSNGSFFTIILYAMPAAIMMAKSAASAMHIWRIHQKGPCDPVNVASVRNSLVWNITSSISSSSRWMPKSDKMLSSILLYR